jgi:hypothetical protein
VAGIPCFPPFRRGLRKRMFPTSFLTVIPAPPHSVSRLYRMPEEKNDISAFFGTNNKP